MNLIENVNNVPGSTALLSWILITIHKSSNNNNNNKFYSRSTTEIKVKRNRKNSSNLKYGKLMQIHSRELKKKRNEKKGKLIELFDKWILNESRCCIYFWNKKKMFFKNEKKKMEKHVAYFVTCFFFFLDSFKLKACSTSTNYFSFIFFLFENTF